MKKIIVLLLVLVVLVGGVFASGATESSSKPVVKVASVNNDAMIMMEKLSKQYTEETGTDVVFTILSENEIRSKITQDVSLGGGGFDLVTLGTSDMGTYLDTGWTEPLDPMFANLSKAERDAYDLNDVIESVRVSCSSTENGLAALPFYSESTMICYNKEIFEKNNLVMPENPTWDEIYQLAAACDDKANGVAGIAIRGLAGYGQNMYIFGSIMYAFGGQYYDMDWNATYDTQAVRNAWKFYKKLLTVAEESPTTSGYTECLNLFAQGKAAIYYDATVSAGTFAGKDSKVAGKVGYANTPTDVKKNNGTIGGWGIAVTANSKNKDAAFDFLRWATSKDYVKLVQKEFGFDSTPSGTRVSTYKDPEYIAACDYAPMTLASIQNANLNSPAINPTPYTGNSLPNLPEFSSWGEAIAAELSAYVAGQKTLDNAISASQALINKAAIEGGYRK